MAVASYRVLFTNQVISVENYKAKAFVTKGTVTEIRTIASDKSIIIVTPLAPDTPVDIQFRIMYYVGDVPATYTPYTGSTTSLTLPLTIYGGEVGAVTGAGKETWKLLTLDGTEEWSDNGTVPTKKEQQWALYNKLAPYSGNFGISSHFDNMKGSLVYPFNYVRISDTSIVFHVALDGPFATADALKAYLAAQYAAGTPAQIAYKLATPVPFQSTGGNTIKALSDTNTILTDADTLTVTGRADPIHIIQQLQAASAASAQALSDVERAVTDI